MPDLFVGLRYTREAWRGAVVPTGETCAEDVSPEGALRLAQRVGELRPVAVLVQAVNRGELLVVIALLERGVRVRVASKEQVRAFAATVEPGLPDATTLVRMAERVQRLGEGVNTPEENDERVRLLLARRRQVLEMQAQEEERLRVAEYGPIREDLERYLDFLDQQLGGLHELLLYTVQIAPNLRVT